jgi:hypothetical protein
MADWIYVTLVARDAGKRAFTMVARPCASAARRSPIVNIRGRPHPRTNGGVKLVASNPAAVEPDDADPRETL